MAKHGDKYEYGKKFQNRDMKMLPVLGVKTLNPLCAEAATKSLFTSVWDQMDGSRFDKFLISEKCDSIVIFKKVKPGGKILMCLFC